MYPKTQRMRKSLKQTDMRGKEEGPWAETPREERVWVVRPGQLGQSDQWGEKVR